MIKLTKVEVNMNQYTQGSLLRNSCNEYSQQSIIFNKSSRFSSKNILKGTKIYKSARNVLSLNQHVLRKKNSRNNQLYQSKISKNFMVQVMKAQIMMKVSFSLEAIVFPEEIALKIQPEISPIYPFKVLKTRNTVQLKIE